MPPPMDKEAVKILGSIEFLLQAVVSELSDLREEVKGIAAKVSEIERSMPEQ
jgi:hypothetical protein